MIQMANEVLSLYADPNTKSVFEGHPVIRCKKKYEELIKLFHACAPDWKGKIQLKFDINSYRIAGQAVYKKHLKEITIRINPSYLMQHPKDTINDTVGHELAHALCFVLHPKERGHGHLWKRSAILFGANPTRCHTLEVPKDQIQRLNRINNNQKLIG